MLFIKNTTFYVIIFVISCIITYPVFPEYPEKNRVEIFLSEIIRSNLYLKSKESAVRATHHAAKNISRTYPDPEIMISRSTSEKDEAVYLPNADYQHTKSEAMEYRVLQPLPFPGKLTTEASVKKSDAKISEIELSIEKNKMAADVLNILVDISRMKHQLAVTQEFQKKIHVLSRVASSRYGTGSGNLADISYVNLKASEYADRVTLLRAEYEAALINLDYYRKGGVAEISDDDLRIYFKKMHEGIPSDEKLADNSLELSLFREMQEKSRHEKNRSRLAFAPDFGIFAGYRKENMKSEYLMYGEGKEKMYSVGLTIKIPLWSAFANISDAREKDEKLRSSDFAKEDFLNRLKYLYSSSEKLTAAYEDRLELVNRSLLPQAKLTVDSARLAWEAKKADFSLLLDGYDALYRQNMLLYDTESQMRKQLVILAQIQNSF